MDKTTIKDTPKILDEVEELFLDIIESWSVPDSGDFDNIQECYIEFLKQKEAVAFRCGFDAGARLRTETKTLIEYKRFDDKTS